MSDSDYIVECPCGVVIRSSDTAQLIAEVQHHARDVHEMTLDEQQVLDMARHA